MGPNGPCKLAVQLLFLYLRPTLLAVIQAGQIVKGLAERL